MFLRIASHRLCTRTLSHRLMVRDEVATTRLAERDATLAERVGDRGELKVF